MIRLAGFQRLLTHISIEEPMADQIHLLKRAEQDAYTIIEKMTPGQLRSEKTTLWRQMESIWSSVPCRLATAFLDLWKFLLLGEGTVKGALDAVLAEARNNRLKRLILRDIRVESKHKGIVKQILSVGEAFQSLFDEVDLDAGQLTIQTERLKAELGLRRTLDLLLAGQRFEQPEKVLAAFWSSVNGLSDPVERNRFFNKILTQLASVMKGSKGGRPQHLVTLFLQLYGRLVQGEPVSTVDAPVQTYLVSDPIDIRHHSLCHMGAVLAPHDPFKRPGFLLDKSQRLTLRVIREGVSNVFLAVPPGWGKTLLSTEAIYHIDRRTGKLADVWYIVPTPETAKQLTGILVSSLYEMEKSGVTQRNIRLALDGETAPTYQRFPSKPDNIIVATPYQLGCLLHSKTPPPLPDRVILDEIHCIGSGDLKTRTSYEYFLKFAAFHKRLIIALSATVGAENFDSFCAWLRSLLTQPLFALQEERRFFEPERLTFRVDPATQRVRIEPIQVLHHLRLDTVRSSTFRIPGLSPADVEQLLEDVPSFPKPILSAPPSQDDVARLEHEVFQHVAQSKTITSLKGDAGTAVASDQLTPYQLYKVLQSMDNSEKPLIVFVMDRKRHLDFLLRMNALVTAYNTLVYANFKDDQSIIKGFLMAAEDLEVEGGGDEEEGETLLTLKRDALFVKECYPELKAFYESYVSQPVDKVLLASFNEEYGATLTEAEILQMRADHVRSQSANLKPDTLKERTQEYVFHPSTRISNVSNADLLRRVRKQLAIELLHQRTLHTEWKNLAYEYGAEQLLQLRRQILTDLSREASDLERRVRKQLAIPFLESDDPVRRHVAAELLQQTTTPLDAEQTARRLQLIAELQEQPLGAEWNHLACELGAAYDLFNNVYEKRKWKPLGIDERRRITEKWTSKAPDDLPGMDYDFEVPWDNWFIQGLEIGILYYNDAFSPAFQHLCMMLMNELALIVVSTSRMCTGINCPFKGSMLHGGFKGEPIERIDPTLGTQGLYRAGRRGFDKKARHFFSGVEIEPLLVPTYHPMGRNDPDLMRPLVEKDSKEFQAFVLTEKRS